MEHSINSIMGRGMTEICGGDTAHSSSPLDPALVVILLLATHIRDPRFQGLLLLRTFSI